MNSREFNALINSWSNKKTKTLDRKKILAAPQEDRHAAAMHIISRRIEVLEELITPLMDRSWLAGMGYMYRFTNPAGFRFVGLCGHQLANESRMRNANK